MSLQPPSSIQFLFSVSRFLPVLAHLYSLIKGTYDTLKSGLAGTLTHLCSFRLCSDENGVFFPQASLPFKFFRTVFPMTEHRKGLSSSASTTALFISITWLHSPLYQWIQSVLPSTCPPSYLLKLKEFIVTIVWHCIRFKNSFKSKAWTSANSLQNARENFWLLNLTLISGRWQGQMILTSLFITSPFPIHY